MYKCFYCKEYFCEECAKNHFDRTVDLCSGFRVFPDGKECGGCPDCKNENSKIFRIGKYYKHSGGRVMLVGGAAKTHIFGNCLIGDDKSGSLIPVGKDETNFVNWKEISKEEYLKHKKLKAGEKLVEPGFTIYNSESNKCYSCKNIKLKCDKGLIPSGDECDFYEEE
jgi:hypothetical protein